MQSEGEDVLHIALLGTPYNAEEMIKLLVEEGADINGQDNHGRSLIMTSIAFGVDDMIPCLLEHGASLSLRDKKGRNALHYAIEEDNNDILELLLLTAEEKGETIINDRDDKGNTPLHLALKGGAREAALLLLSYAYIDVNVVDKEGTTPLMLVVWKEDYQLIEMILDLGADPSISNANGLNAFFTAVDREDMKLIDLLVTKAEVYLNQQDAKGNTLLHWAVIKHSPEIVSVLLLNGADTTIANHDGYTPARLASINGFSEIEHLFTNATTTAESFEDDDYEEPPPADDGGAVEGPPDDSDLYDF